MAAMKSDVLIYEIVILAYVTLSGFKGTSAAMLDVNIVINVTMKIMV